MLIYNTETVDICSGSEQYMVADPIEVVSPNFGSNNVYPLNMDCVMRLDAALNHQVNIFDF